MTTMTVAYQSAVIAAVFVVAGAGLVVGFATAAVLTAIVDWALHRQDMLKLKREHLKRLQQIELAKAARVDVNLPAPATLRTFLEACQKIAGADGHYLPTAQALGITERERDAYLGFLAGQVEVVPGRPPKGALSSARVVGGKTIGDLL